MIIPSLGINFAGGGGGGGEAVLTSATFSANSAYTPAQGVDGWSAVTVNVDETPAYNSGYTEGSAAGFASGETVGYASGSTDGYASGYTDGGNAGYASGTTDGAAAQKALLSSTSITENGEYTSENGFSAVTVNVSGGGGENRVNSLLRKTLTAVTSSDLNGLTRIPEYAFAGCTGLVSCATIPGGNLGTTIGEYAFKNCSALTSVSFVRTSKIQLDEGAFAGCSNLNSFPSSAVSIYSIDALSGCTSLSGNIDLSPDLISNRAFRDCTGITSFTFLNNFGAFTSSNSFQGCTGVQYIDMTHNTVVPSLRSSTMFSAFTANYEIRVPASLYETWIATSPWSDISSHIVSVS